MNYVEMRGISKNFGRVQALRNVDFTLRAGEIHALLGENGAGKTTLMKILYGIHQPSSGTIAIKGRTTGIGSSREAYHLGIGMVHQHFMLIPVLTVAENVVAGNEPRKGVFFDMDKAVEEVEKLADSCGFKIDPRAKVETLSVGEMQRVEIMKVLYKGADILILDEPTAVLTPVEVVELFQILRQLQSEGKSIILITHKLYEVMDIADRVTILRDGELIKSVEKKDVDINSLAALMVGREVVEELHRPSEKIGKLVCDVRNLSYVRNGIEVLNDISLQVHEGEILGVAGVEGNGQSELLEALTGILTPDSMEFLVNGKKVSGSPADFIRAGVGHVPEDRMTRGLALSQSVADNLIFGYEEKPEFSHRCLMKWKEIHRFAKTKIEEYGIKAQGPNTISKTLSGGNQQKIVVARVFSENPEFVVCAQPTRGVDIAAAEYIHQVMLDYRDKGKAILLVSADLDEVKQLSDTIVVLYDGKIVAKGKPEEFDDRRLGLLMTGAEIS